MKLKNIILLGTAAVALTACDDLFEPALENNHDLSEMEQDAVFARGIIDNAFMLIPIEANGVASSDNGISTDVATDDAVTNNNDNNYKKMALGSWTSSVNAVNNWDSRYHAIQYCNLFLEHCDDVEWDYSNAGLNEMHKDLYKGNAYALRGLQLLYLLRAHCGMVDGVLMGVPIHLQSEDGGSDFNQPRNTFKECIDQIMADFDEAEKYLPKSYGNISNDNLVPEKYRALGATTKQYNYAFGNHEKGKIDGRMIAAFKAQAALFAASPAYQSGGAMTWEQAAQYAKLSLDNVGGINGIDPSGWTWFCNYSYIDNYSYTDDDPLEVVWRGNVMQTNTLETDYYPPSLYGNARLNPSQNLVDAFPTAYGYPITDSRSGYDPQNPYANRDPRLKMYIVCNGDVLGALGGTINTTINSETLDGKDKELGKSTLTGYYLRKHLRDDMNLELTNNNKWHWGARIRYTEIFLDYAEAANEAAGPKTAVGGANYSAYDVIKALRQRAGIKDPAGYDPYLEECANNKDKMRELIRNERRLELCFENHRFWDLRRWKAPLNEAVKGVNITANTDGTFKYEYVTVETRNYQDYMYYGPIPNSEILKFSNLRQNDGW